MGDELSWLERLAGSQKVIGSTPIFSTKNHCISSGFFVSKLFIAPNNILLKKAKKISGAPEA